MAETKFDPAGYYEIDFATGQVRTRTGERVVVLTDTALTALVSSLASSLPGLEALGRSLGTLGRQSLGDLEQASPEAVLHHTGALLGVFGWGALGMEQWGEALLLRLRRAPVGPEGCSVLLAALIGAMTAREVSCVHVGDDGYLVLHPSAADVVRGRAGKEPVGQLLANLEAP